MKLKRYLLIGSAIVLVILLGAVGAIYAVLRFGVLPLRDGTTLGDGSVTTVVTGNFGPIAIGAYTIKLANGGIALIDAGMDENRRVSYSLATAPPASATGRYDQTP